MRRKGESQDSGTPRAATYEAVTTRLSAPILAGVLVLASGPVPGADFLGRPTAGRFLATCEDPGRFCATWACGRDQIEAALICRARCPGAVVLGVVPAACVPPDPAPIPVLRRRG